MAKKLSSEQKHFNQLVNKVARLTFQLTMFDEQSKLLREKLDKLRDEVIEARKTLVDGAKYALNAYEKALAIDNKIMAIKAVRERYARRDPLTGGTLEIVLGLKESKDLVDDYLRSIDK